MKLIKGIKQYLTDWRNLLTHGIVGVVLLWAMLFAPLAPVYRVIILIGVIVFNIVRMRLTNNKGGV